MSKRARTESSGDRVVLDVGGTSFTTSVSTLSSSSTYFEALFSRWDEASNEVVFLDRDPDAFRVLLSCMRQKKAMLPEDKDLFKRVLMDAVFLGIEWLLVEVKAQTFDNLHFNDAADILERYNGSGIFDDTMPDSDSAYTLSKPQRATLFDYDLGQRGSDPLDVALSLGYLPAMYFASATGNYKIKQLIPCHEGTSVVFFDENRDDEQNRKAVCLALVENIHGRSHIEPVVRGRGIRMPYQDIVAGGGWLTMDPEDQLVTASDYQGDYGVDGGRHWAFAYKGEADAEGIPEKLRR